MKRLFLARVVPALTIGFFCTAKGLVGASPVLFTGNGHYYDFVTASLTWDNANLAAQAQTYLGVTGHLATITSAAEDAFIYNQVMLPNIAAPDFYHDAWLGGYQLPGSPEPAGGWVWITGESWNYTNWGAGEPNNGVGYNVASEDVLTMRGTGFWNDSTRDYSAYPNLAPPVGYVLEFDVPEPDSSALAALGAGALFLFPRRRTVQPRI